MHDLLLLALLIGRGHGREDIGVAHQVGVGIAVDDLLLFQQLSQVLNLNRVLTAVRLMLGCI